MVDGRYINEEHCIGRYTENIASVYMQNIIASFGGYDPAQKRCHGSMMGLLDLIAPQEYNAETHNDIVRAMKQAGQVIQLPLDGTMQNSSILSANMILDVFRSQLAEVSAKTKKLLHTACRMYLDFGFVYLLKNDRAWHTYNLNSTYVYEEKGVMFIVTSIGENAEQEYFFNTYNPSNKLLESFGTKNRKHVIHDKKDFIIMGDGKNSCGQRSVYPQMLLQYYQSYS